MPSSTLESATKKSPGFVARLLPRLHAKAFTGGIIVLIFIAVGLLGPNIAPHDPNKQELTALKKPPQGLGSAHVLGTDNLGRDILSRVIRGARVSLLVAFAVVFISGIIGVGLGAISGYLGGKTDFLIQKFVEVVWAFPPLLPLQPLLKRAAKAGSKIQAFLHAGNGSPLPVLISIRPLATPGASGATLGCQPFAGPSNSSVAQAFGVNVNNCVPNGGPVNGTCSGAAIPGSPWPASCVGGFRNGQGCAPNPANPAGVNADCMGAITDATELAKNPMGLLYSRDEVRKQFKITLQNAGKLTWPISIEKNPSNPAHVASWDQANNCVTDMGMPVACGTALKVDMLKI